MKDRARGIERYGWIHLQFDELYQTLINIPVKAVHVLHQQQGDIALGADIGVDCRNGGSAKKLKELSFERKNMNLFPAQRWSR
jgi:hypothetical protein